VIAAGDDDELLRPFDPGEQFLAERERDHAVAIAVQLEHWDARAIDEVGRREPVAAEGREDPEQQRITDDGSRVGESRFDDEAVRLADRCGVRRDRGASERPQNTIGTRDSPSAHTRRTNASAS
jgi:hypothetical protein